MDTIYELDNEPAEEPTEEPAEEPEEEQEEEPEYLDDRERKRELWIHSIIVVIIGLTTLIILAQRFNSPCPWTEGRRVLMQQFGELAREGWLFSNGIIYYISTTKSNWMASREYCLQRNSDLMVIDTEGEKHFISSFSGAVWIGASERDSQRTSKWVDGTNEVSGSGSSEPDDERGEDCVAWDGRLTEEPCDRLHYWICEKVLDLEHLGAEPEALNRTEEAPSITEFHSSTAVLPAGRTARFTCHASGTPEPSVEWLHNGRPLESTSTDRPSEPAAWVERGFLLVRGVRSGVNTVCCVANNNAGSANRSAELLVFDACELTLDPNTASRELSLSENNRKVTRVREEQPYPDLPERFDPWPQVLCREGLTGRCYWEVEWKGRVNIAVTYRGIPRRGGGADSLLGRNNKSWGLTCYDGGYIAWYNNHETTLPRPPAGSNRVGVYLDRPAGSLSFYTVSPDVGGSSHTLTHLHTFRSTFTQEDLLPGFGLWDGASVSLCRM